jgi:hypothetical protein
VITVDPLWWELYERRAREGDRFDLVLDVRPLQARRANPYPAPCLEMYADDVIDNMGWLARAYSRASCRLCCICWSGMRAVRVVSHLWGAGWDAYYWALSPVARSGQEEN